MREIKDFDKIMIKLASPDQIRSWSYGEVKKPETINYRTLRPERDGLFCERIFGTTKEWECYCGKFKSIRYKGVICDRCGVEVTHFRVRRERMGHIELACPVSHIWYYRLVPSRMGLLLDLSVSDLRSILYYEKYVVINPGDTDLKQNELLNEDSYRDARAQYGEGFTAGIGAEAVRTLLENLDLDAIAMELRQQMAAKGAKSDKRLLKRIEIVENFRDSANKPEWMVMDVIPVIPPELRPMVQLDGGRFASSDLNDLYRRVINRNNRLKRLLTLHAPDIIIRNEKRMLQEAVDALFDNSKKKRSVKGASNRPLRSLSDMLKGKQGRFRQNLLGKRVDYSGRSVIVVGPELKLHQCGLPAKMALELYKPFIMKRLVEKDVVFNIKRAKNVVEEEGQEVWEILDEVVREHPVLLNRAPTLHRLGIQAFEPVLVQGKAIKLHPLVCTAFNADFDGDQMPVHVPLTQAAQIECWTLMLSSRNLLDPANGNPIVFPSQDMVLGIYYLTKMRPGAKGEGKFFTDSKEIEMALDVGSVEYASEIKYRLPETGEVITTTPGRIIFHETMPDEVPFQNYCLGDKQLQKLIAETLLKHGQAVGVRMLDIIKDIGFKYGTLFGATIGVSDIVIPNKKSDMIEDANNQVVTIQGQYQAGHITQEERYNRVVEVWGKTNEDLTNVLMDVMKESQDGFNPVYMMADSGARGSRTQIRQLSGMRGLMAKPNGDIIELPIRSNFKEGLSVIEFFISTNGARKGLADTAIKTASAGYLTRRLVDIAQDVVVNDEDCGTINGIEMSALKDGEDVVESLRDRIVGRFTIEAVRHPITGDVIVDVNEEITEEVADEIEALGIESVSIRSVLTCEARHGVCQRCYGRNLANNRTVEIGEAVGIIAAQSIGQPGTQLTMRTFHIGGVATQLGEDNTITLKYPILVKELFGNTVDVRDGVKLFTRKGYVNVARIIRTLPLAKGMKVKVAEGDRVVNGTVIATQGKQEILSEEVAIVHMREGELLLIAQDQRIDIRNGSELLVATQSVLPAGEPLATFDPFSEPIIAEVEGTVKFVDILLGTTLREEVNEETGVIEKKITDFSSEALQPRIEICNAKGEALVTYYLPGSSYLSVKDGQAVQQGATLAKLLKESAKTKDITGGLARVGDLFEARKPRNIAVLSRVTGTVHFSGIVKSKRVLTVSDDHGNEFKHLVPMGKYLLVRDGDLVSAGEPLSEGDFSPHDILDILGENALQSFLLNEIQEVYRLAGVNINDKHISVIIRQMMRKVEIVEVGDTHFIYGQQVDKYRFHEENSRVVENGGEPAVARPFLLGITRASLSIDSFISAASFQETTKVLTNAAIAGSTDELRGLKENVIIGHQIPAGTGMRKYRKMKIYDENSVDLDLTVQQVMEQRKREQEEREREEEMLKVEQEILKAAEVDADAEDADIEADGAMPTTEAVEAVVE